MPPRKKAKAQDKGAGQDQTTPPGENSLNDPWSNEQETQLFKSMMKWKPTGLHKHFRMISIHNNMRSHGFATEEHTRIPGVWRKLEQLYDLHALDERENSYAFQDLPDPLDREDMAEIPDFELPEEEFGELMWLKRFHGPESVASSSPPLMPVEDDKALYQPGLGLLRDLPEGSKPRKAESPQAATPTPKSAKNTRASRAAAKNGKSTKSGQAAKNNKAQSAVSESAEEEEEEEDDDEEAEEDTAQSEAETAPSTRRTNRSAARAKPAPKRTRKR